MPRTILCKQVRAFPSRPAWVTILMATLLGLASRCHSSLPSQSLSQVRSGGLRMARELPDCPPYRYRVRRFFGCH
jgi:hypothetical protein